LFLFFLIRVILVLDGSCRFIYIGAVVQTCNTPQTKRCVIADADPFISRLLIRFAERSGLIVCQYTGEQDIIGYLVENQPSVVIIDPDLPGRLKGRKIIELMKANLETRNIPIIACYWPETTDLSAFSKEIEGYLRKPDIRYPNFTQALLGVGVEVEG